MEGIKVLHLCGYQNKVRLVGAINQLKQPCFPFTSLWFFLALAHSPRAGLALAFRIAHATAFPSMHKLYAHSSPTHFCFWP